jgi:Ca2+/Na+ antiporter
MIWIVALVLQIAFIVAGIRREQRAGLWSWSKFLFALGFAAVEVVLAVVPVLILDLHGRGSWWIIGAGWLIAALNFIWFIIACRRWKLPDGRTSLQADRGQSR